MQNKFCSTKITIVLTCSDCEKTKETYACIDDGFDNIWEYGNIEVGDWEVEDFGHRCGQCQQKLIDAYRRGKNG